MVPHTSSPCSFLRDPRGGGAFTPQNKETGACTGTSMHPVPNPTVVEMCNMVEAGLPAFQRLVLGGKNKGASQQNLTVLPTPAQTWRRACKLPQSHLRLHVATEPKPSKAQGFVPAPSLLPSVRETHTP